MPAPHGDVAVSWKLDGNKLSLDVTVPPGSEAEIIIPADCFDRPRVTLKGSPSSAKVRVKEGRSQLELTGVFKPNP